MRLPWSDSDIQFHSIRSFSSKKQTIIIILLILNVLYLNYIVLFRAPNSPSSSTLSNIESSEMSENANITQAESCASVCQEIVDTAIAKIEPQNVATVKSPPLRESFIPFGSGASQAGDWENVAGLQSYVDSTAYDAIQKVVFEISMHVPSGNQIVWARLYNVTKNYPVWNSEVSMQGSEPQLLISKPITLEPGNTLYQVQIKTQLKALTRIDQARLHITAH